MIGLRSPVIHEKTRVYCRWCGGVIRLYVSAIRRKESSGDTSGVSVKYDYHEECWNEAIEVQV